MVEDDARMAALLKQALSEEGHVVLTAAAGDEALSVAGEADLDVIVLDIMLPVSMGLRSRASCEMRETAFRSSC